MQEIDEMSEISNFCETSEDENKVDGFKDVKKELKNLKKHFTHQVTRKVKTILLSTQCYLL